jgi:hypothetical protein
MAVPPALRRVREWGRAAPGGNRRTARRRGVRPAARPRECRPLPPTPPRPTSRRSREATGGLVEPRYVDPGVAALHQQADRSGIEIDVGQRCIVCVEHGAPDRVGRIIRVKESDRGMRHEADAPLVLGRKRREPGQVERRGIGGMNGVADGPFEMRDIGEVGERGGGLKVAQEFRELGAVLVEIGRAGRVLRDEQSRGALEEIGADQPVNGRVGQPQRLGDAGEEGIAVDVQAVGPDMLRQHRRDRAVIAVEEARAHGTPRLKQRRHCAPPVRLWRAARGHGRPRRAARRGSARRCPIRSASAPGRTGRAPPDRAPTPRR